MSQNTIMIELAPYLVSDFDLELLFFDFGKTLRNAQGVIHLVRTQNFPKK